MNATERNQTTTEIAGNIGELSVLHPLGQTLLGHEASHDPQMAAVQLLHAAVLKRVHFQTSGPIIASFSVCPDPLLDKLREQIGTAIDRFARSRTDPRFTPFDREREEENAKQVVCEALTNVRRYNRSSIPSDLEDIREAFGCP